MSTRPQEHRAWEAPRRRRVPRAVTACVLAAAVAAAALALSGRAPDAGPGRDGDPGQPSGLVVRPGDADEQEQEQERAGPRRVATVPVPTPQPLAPLPGTWERQDDVPLPPARAAAAVWTGRLLVVVGDAPPGDGDGQGGQPLAAWDAASGQWQRLDPPLPPRHWPELVWTGRELLVAGGWSPQAAAGQGGGDGQGTYTVLRPRSDGAAWDPATGAWRSLPGEGRPEGLASAVWTGRALHVWARDGGAGWDVHAYDPGADAWQPVASPALAAVAGRGAGYARGRPLLWGVRAGTEEPTLLVGASRVDVGLPANLERPIVTVVDDGVMVVGTVRGRPAAARYRLGRGWEPLRTGPELGGAPGWAASVWTGDRLVLADERGRVVAYHPAGDRWERIASTPRSPRDVHALAWTGERLILLTTGAGSERRLELHTWHPAG